MSTPVVAPLSTDRSAFYWTSGREGVLRIATCGDCGFRIHPPRPACPSCRGRDVTPQSVSGRGTVWSFTISRRAWVPGIEAPYVVAEIELDEQPGLRVLSTVTGGEVAIGIPVTVSFVEVDGAHVPVFSP